jgi:hypothetical protein
LGSDAECQPAETGTAPDRSADVRPVAWANRRKERTDRAIDFAEFVLRSLQNSTMNAVTMPASRRLTETSAGWANIRRNCATALL